MGSGDDADGAADAGARHLGKRVGEERMPVAHPDVDRQRRAGARQPLAQALGLAHRQLGDRRDAAEELVVMRDFFDPLGRDAAAAQHVLEKRPDVGRPLRAAERDHQHGVEGLGHVTSGDYTGSA